MSRFGAMVGQLPFAGRAVVENTVLSAIGERTSFREKNLKYGRAMLLLTAYVAAHGMQAKLGAGDLEHDIQALDDGVSIQDGAEVAISGLYTLANAAVTYAQLELIGRVTKNYAKFIKAIRRGEELADEDYQFRRRRSTVAELGLTGAGQALFIAQIDKIDLGF